MIDFNFKDTTKNFIELNGFTTLTKVQEACVKMAKKGKDIVAISPTGTGKTHAFLIPIMELVDTKEDVTQVVISLPTKELAIQLADRLKTAKEVLKDLRVLLLSSGIDSLKAKNKLKRAPHIIIGTPGKIKELFDDNSLRVDSVKLYVIDEADMTLEYGFLEDIDKVFAKMPENLEVMCFSATLSDNLKPFIKRYLNGPDIIKIDNETTFNPNIDHVLINCKHKEYDEALLDLLPCINPYVCLIFANTREECHKTYETLKSNGYKALEIHGGLSSRERSKAMKLLKEKDYTYIVASDVASRGIDIDAITHVVSLGLPSDLAFYTHRSGRTGRSGKHGTCFLLYKESDQKAIDTLIKQGIAFKSKTIKQGSLVDVRMRERKLSKSEVREKELDRQLYRKKEKVKPNYKKKKTALINRIKQKERREFIKAKIKEEKKARYKANNKG